MKQKRIIAFLIDAFSIVFLTIIVRLILNVDDAQLSLMFFSLLASFLIICKDCCNGNSFGKYLMKIQIIDERKMQPASPFKCVIRNYLYFIWIVELIMFLCSKSGNRLGDYFTRTKVVERVEGLREIDKLRLILTVFLVALFFVLIYIYVYLSVSHTKTLFSLIIG